jgi:hypothetical protein
MGGGGIDHHIEPGAFWESAHHSRSDGQVTCASKEAAASCSILASPHSRRWPLAHLPSTLFNSRAKARGHPCALCIASSKQVFESGRDFQKGTGHRSRNVPAKNKCFGRNSFTDEDKWFAAKPASVRLKAPPLKKLKDAAL